MDLAEAVGEVVAAVLTDRRTGAADATCRRTEAPEEEDARYSRRDSKSGREADEKAGDMVVVVVVDVVVVARQG